MKNLRPTFAVPLVLALLVTAAGAAQALVAPTAPSSQAGATASPAKAVVRSSPVQRPESRPSWSELSSDQQVSLRPLAAIWNGLSEPHKRKWIALSSNFRQLSPTERSKLHSRMAEWATLSPQQRATARLNFGEIQAVPADDKKAKWEAYQALSAEEKHKLRAGAVAPPTPAAAVKPVPSQRLATVPRSNRETKPPRIAAGPVADHPVQPAHGQHTN